MFAFLDGYLKHQTPPPPSRTIRYHTLGERAWHTTATWPPAGLTSERWFFAANGVLDHTQPSSEDGADRYAVDFTATSGPLNRWHTQAGSDVVYPEPPFPVFGPYHSFKRADAEPLVPGKQAELRFSLWPTSVLIPQGPPHPGRDRWRR